MKFWAIVIGIVALLWVISLGVVSIRQYQSGYADGIIKASAACRAAGGEVVLPEGGRWRDRKKRKKIIPFLSPVPEEFQNGGDDEGDSDVEDSIEPVEANVDESDDEPVDVGNIAEEGDEI